MPASACAPGCRHEATWWPVGLKKAPSRSWPFGLAMMRFLGRESTAVRQSGARQTAQDRPLKAGGSRCGRQGFGAADCFRSDEPNDRLYQPADVTGMRTAIEAADRGACGEQARDRRAFGVEHTRLAVDHDAAHGVG